MEIFMKRIEFYTMTLATFIFLFIYAPGALADEAKPGKFENESDAEIARKLQGPVSPLASLDNVFEYFTYKGDQPGADSQTSFTYSFQPKIPFRLENGKFIIFRPLIPILLDEPVFNPARNDFDSVGPELGDIAFDLGYGYRDDGVGTMGLIGLFGSLPTATDDAVASNQFRLGPEVALGLIREWGQVGFLVAHFWNVGGSNKEDFSITTIEYFYSYGLGGGWEIAAGPTIEADWEANKGDTWTVPVGIGIGKTTKFGNTPWSVALEVDYYVEQPNSFGPKLLLVFTITPVIENPFSN